MGLLVIGWLALAGYIFIRKPALLKTARTELRAKIGGESSIGDIDISFFRHFPNISLHISKVTLRDSLWERHHHDLLKAEEVYLGLDVTRSLLDWRLQLGKVYLEHGSIYLYTDSTGYSNTAGLSHQQQGRQDKDIRPPDCALSDIRLVIERQDKDKIFDFDIRQLNSSVDKEGRQLRFGMNVNILVRNLVFRADKGSFIKDRLITGHFTIAFNTGSKVLDFKKARLQIGGHPFLFSGRFFPDVSPDPFFLSIETENIQYKDASALLTPALQQKLDAYEIDKPVNVLAQLDAGSAEDAKPLITVRMDVRDNSINSPIGRLDNVSFSGFFTNEAVHGQKREDENSALRLLSFSGTLENILLHSDTLQIMDLRRPILTCDLHSNFPLARLNDLGGSQSLIFRKGGVKLNVRYKGPLTENDSVKVALNGGLEIDSGTIGYLPYRMELEDCQARFKFDNQDIRIDKLETRTGSSRILVSGMARGAASLLDTKPGNITMNLRVVSPSLNLEDLSAMLGKPAGPVAAKKEKQSRFAAPAGRLDQLLRDGSLRVLMEAADLHYKKFKGAHAKAELLFADNAIQVDHVQLEQGAGSMSGSGRLVRRAGPGNPLSIHSHLENVDLPTIFTAFSNFGQDAIHDKNLKGRLTADIDIKGLLTDKAGVVPNSLTGQVDFSIVGGQLLNFEPMEKIQTVLKKRDLSEIHFAELKTRMDLDSGTFRIHRMEIRSTAFTLFAEGTYDTKAGTDMSLVVPLSNLKGRDTGVPPEVKGNDSKAGLSLRLRAKTGDDGKVKISWDPFRRAQKAARLKKRH